MTVKINLYHGTTKNEPVQSVEAEYESLARMSDRALTQRLVTAFGGQVEDCPMHLEIDEPGRPTLTRQWMPMGEAGDELEYELQLQARDLVTEWRAE